jgi:hypothetical protein
MVCHHTVELIDTHRSCRCKQFLEFLHPRQRRLEDVMPLQRFGRAPIVHGRDGYLDLHRRQALKRVGME